MNVTRTILKGGRIYDGTASEPFVGDILFQGDKILEVAPSIDAPDAEVIDISGLSVSSGCFDAHSHNDWFAIKKQPVKYFEPFIRQGITSFITGNCGLSAVGFEADTPYKDKIGGGLFSYSDDTTGVYPDVESYFSAIDGNTPCNIALLLGHCSARASVAGDSNRKLDSEELERMMAILEKGLRQGACGLSLGLMYVPGIYDCFPKFLRCSLLGTGDTMPRTIRKMTGAVADRFSIRERGYVKPGYFADFTIFNEDALKDGTPDCGKSFGIEKVFINGRCVLNCGELDKEALKTTGRAIRA